MVSKVPSDNGRPSLLPVPRSGKLPKRIRHAQAIDKAELYLSKNLLVFMDDLIILARGYGKVMEGKDGEEYVYYVPPDRDALKYLIDRGMGKVATRMEITGGDGGPVQAEFIAWVPREEEKNDEDAIDG